MAKGLSLFEAFGVELEYMIVDRQSLDVRPLTDQVLRAVAGQYVSEVEQGTISWSNELALHVIELKTTEPAPSLAPLSQPFEEQIRRIDELLEPLAARLMPTGMHPWMHPDRELKLWPHEYNPVYEAYNRIFDCRGHGWANLQSVHLNLPFSGDEQFGRLHAAIRLLLPLLPGLAASSPIVEGHLTGIADNRMHVYRSNALRVPLVAAQLVPEPVFSRQDYEQQIFHPMYAQIRPFDPQGILCHEWLNSRGAIARFDRNAIEIRVLDVQECPAADLAICEAIVGVLKLLISERWSPLAEQQSLSTQPLAELLQASTLSAELAEISEPAYLRQMGVSQNSVTVGEMWQHLIDCVSDQVTNLQPLELILEQGPLSRRIARAVHRAPDKLADIYRKLCECLREGQLFRES
jgi:carboxylate-amine ligase